MQRIDEEQRHVVRRYAKVLRDLRPPDRLSPPRTRLYGAADSPVAGDKSKWPTLPWERKPIAVVIAE